MDVIESHCKGKESYMLEITAINGNDLTKCEVEDGESCKNSYSCKVDNDLKCGLGCTKEECRKER